MPNCEIDLVLKYLNRKKFRKTKKKLERFLSNHKSVIREKCNEKENLESIYKNYFSTKKKIRECMCNSTADFGPDYLHLGTSDSKENLKKDLIRRFRVNNATSVRIHEVKYAKHPGKNMNGCPVSQTIISRSSEEEEYLVLVKRRIGHYCKFQWSVIAIIAWSPFEKSLADEAYNISKKVLGPYGIPNKRFCEFNSKKSCKCQGKSEKNKGTSYSFGCSYSTFSNTCKFARSIYCDQFRVESFTPSYLKSGLQDCYQTITNQMTKLCARIVQRAVINMLKPTLQRGKTMFRDIFSQSYDLTTY